MRTADLGRRAQARKSHCVPGALPPAVDNSSGARGVWWIKERQEACGISRAPVLACTAGRPGRGLQAAGDTTGAGQGMPAPAGRSAARPGVMLRPQVLADLTSKPQLRR
jgi:hypothetical protein